jgi:hypothetical protein
MKLTQYATTPYLLEALDHAASLQLAADQWKPAAENFEKLVKDFPACPWAGDAYVALIDIRLERLLDLDGAQEYADAAVKWYESNSPRAPGEGQATGSPRPYPGEGQGVRAGQGEGTVSAAADPFSPFPVTPTGPAREVAYAIYLRAGQYFLRRAYSADGPHNDVDDTLLQARYDVEGDMAAAKKNPEIKWFNPTRVCLNSRFNGAKESANAVILFPPRYGAKKQ